MKRVLSAVVVFATLLIITADVRADAESVKKYITDATELVGKGPQFFADAASKLELAAASMDDVPAADKPGLQTQIDALKTQMSTAEAAGDKTRLERQTKDLMTEVEGLVGNMVAFQGKADELTTILNDPKTTAALGEPAVTGMKKQFATMLKVHQGKALTENLGNAKTAVDELEKTWTQNKVKVASDDEQARNGALIDTGRDLEQIERYFKDLPADNADVKSLRARVDKVKTDQGSATAGAGATSEIERINRWLEDNKRDTDGMDAETAGPSWADYKQNQGASAVRELNAPKTMEYVRKTSYFLENLEKEQDYQATKNDARVKAVVDPIRAKLAASRDKLNKSLSRIMDEAQKEGVTKNNMGDIGSLTYLANNALGAESTEAKALNDRADKMQKDFAAAGNKAEADTAAYYKSMTEQANKAWPDMMGKFSVSEGFDPNNAGAMKGKYIKLTGKNRMGWQFKTGDFGYAIRVNGVAIAGKYAPEIKAALSEVEAKLGRAIGDSDDDGDWTAIAQVDGSTGQLIEFVSSTGDVTVDGTKVGTVEGRHERPVDAPIVTIVALKAGPVAAAQGQGAVKEDGTVSAPAAVVGPMGSSGHGFSIVGLISGLLAIVVGAACLMKAKFAPLAGNAGAMQMSEKIGSQNLAYLGLAAIVLGVLGLLMNLIALPGAFLHAIIGMLASLAMIIAGGVTSQDFLAERKILPAQAAPILSQYAIPAGIACAALGVLTVIFSL